MNPYKLADDLRSLLGYGAETTGLTIMEYIETAPNKDEAHAESLKELVFLFRPCGGMF
jgi:hypothetical protein